jgi:hypothetical protein
VTQLLLDTMVWFQASLLLGGVAVAACWLLARGHQVTPELATPSLLHVFYGSVIGMMGTGHLVAVTIKAAHGSLSPDVSPWFVYPLGAAIAVPGWLLVLGGAMLPSARAWPRRLLVILDSWLVSLFVPLGPSAVLAVPAVLSLVWMFSRRESIRRAAVLSSVVAYGLMLVASMAGLGDF